MNLARINEDSNNFDTRLCVDNYVNRVITPKLRWIDKKSLRLKAIDKATGVITFLRAFRKDACKNDISEFTQKALIKAVFKTPLALKSGILVGGLAAGSLALGKVGLSLGILSLGGILIFKVLPQAIDRLVDKGYEGLKNLGSETRNYLNKD